MRPFCYLVFFFLASQAQASSAFNGTFCGAGEVKSSQDQTTQQRAGKKVLSVSVSNSVLNLQFDRVYFEDGSYMDGRPEVAVIRDGKIIYNNEEVGAISDSEIFISTTISGYLIEYRINNLGSGKISYFRSSVKQSSNFAMESNFPVLEQKSNCK